MIDITNTKIFGYEAAIRGMRNPMNSWDKSDSGCGCSHEYEIFGNCDLCDKYIGKQDYNLMLKLSKAGTDHAKFMRYINVTLDINAPLYWWKEFDTYKIGTVSNSCSTMHKLDARDLVIDDFSSESFDSLNPLLATINHINELRLKYLATSDKKYWRQMIQLLPSSYNQTRNVMISYEALLNMYHARKNHKLQEWKDFCEWVTTLPLSEIITVPVER